MGTRTRPYRVRRQHPLGLPPHAPPAATSQFEALTSLLSLAGATVPTRLEKPPSVMGARHTDPATQRRVSDHATNCRPPRMHPLQRTRNLPTSAWRWASASCPNTYSGDGRSMTSPQTRWHLTRCQQHPRSHANARCWTRPLPTHATHAPRSLARRTTAAGWRCRKEHTATTAARINMFWAENCAEEANGGGSPAMQRWRENHSSGRVCVICLTYRHAATWCR